MYDIIANLQMGFSLSFGLSLFPATPLPVTPSSLHSSLPIVQVIDPRRADRTAKLADGDALGEAEHFGCEDSSCSQGNSG